MSRVRRASGGRARLGKRSFALVSVLLVLTVLAVACAAFLTSTRLERIASRGYLNLVRAEQAVAAGMVHAKSDLLRGTSNDFFLVVRATNAAGGDYYFIGYPKDHGPTNVLYHPLFSGGVTNVQPITRMPEVRFDAGHAGAAGLPLRPSWMGTNVETRWIVWSNHFGEPSFRYCYWIEDLGGYLDAQTAGNTNGPGGAHLRGGGTNASDLAMFTLFDPTKFNDETSLDNAIITNRPYLLTPDTIRLALPETNRDAATNFVSNLRGDEEREIIPYGFGYAGEGQPKINLNTLLAGRDVDGIAAAIRTNLPRFEERRGGFTNDNYHKTLAACILDYADTNDTATLGVEYRGIDSQPFVSEYWMRTLADRTNRAGTWYVTAEVTFWIEVWNPADAGIQGEIQFSPTNRYRMTAGTATLDFGNPGTALQGGLPLSSYPVVLEANEYKALNLGTALYEIAVGPLAPGVPFSMPEHWDSGYEMRWNGNRAERAGKGMARLTRSVYPRSDTSRHVYSCSVPGFLYRESVGGTFLNGNVGDPRSSWWNTAPHDANAFSSGSQNISYGGRNRRHAIAAGNVYSTVWPSRWPDGGHDSTEGSLVNYPAGPDAGVRPANQPQTNMAPAHISNRGYFVSVAELGHVYDPIQWQVYSGASADEARKKWPDITTSATPDSRYGGGASLRIGRPEFSRFDKPEQRALALLDIFCAASSRQTRGLVNLNTAGRDVLRALGGGMALTRDREIVPAGATNAPKDSMEGDRFADAVIASRPFASTAQLGIITNSLGPYFGNTNQWTAVKPSEWKDAAAEELFARTLDLCSVRGRNFRIFVAGEALARTPSGDAVVVGRSHRAYQVFVRPGRDTAGTITNQTVEVIYAENL